MQLIDALIESCRAGNEAPALNRNGELVKLPPFSGQVVKLQL